MTNDFVVVMAQVRNEKSLSVSVYIGISIHTSSNWLLNRHTEQKTQQQ